VTAAAVTAIRMDVLFMDSPPLLSGRTRTGTRPALPTRTPHRCDCWFTALVTPQTTAPRAINVTMIFMISSWKRASKHTRRSVALIMACDAEGVPTAAVFYRISQQDDMDTSTLLIIIIVVLIVLGGGWYGRGRWY
jgi:hypothetical protein